MVRVSNSIGTRESKEAIISFTQLDQTLEFTTEQLLAPYEEPVIALTGETSSGLNINYEVLEGPGTIEDNQLILNGYGLVTVKAAQPGNDLYLPSVTIERTIKVYSPYNWWRLQNFGGSEGVGNSDSFEDPDNDKLYNIHEYFLGTSPKHFTNAMLFESFGEGENLYMQTRQFIGSLDGLDVVPEVSNDLSIWTSLENQWVEIDETDNGDLLYKLKAGSLPPQTFIRLRIEAL